ncbi:hypothetical protein CWI75_10670 [Kineobactrum sediminis]|uniref:Uncharacterized protein n=1 Tax=Kineobactrum sediminis TaxID=1905677 RepID=A0A2N5Y1H3_9GAMM|nr:hypothetical protein [Kineobactrum sediminis]PLW82233.1 hypothetical protein CWI75_10670 [Kineobactrum sediminis]
MNANNPSVTHAQKVLESLQNIESRGTRVLGIASGLQSIGKLIHRSQHDTGYELVREEVEGLGLAVAALGDALADVWCEIDDALADGMHPAGS